MQPQAATFVTARAWTYPESDAHIVPVKHFSGYTRPLTTDSYRESAPIAYRVVSRATSQKRPAPLKWSESRAEKKVVAVSERVWRGEGHVKGWTRPTRPAKAGLIPEWRWTPP